MIGSMLNMIWPLLLIGRGIFVLNAKHQLDVDGSVLHKFFPGPKEIESRAERDRRLRQYAEKEWTP